MRALKPNHKLIDGDQPMTTRPASPDRRGLLAGAAAGLAVGALATPGGAATARDTLALLVPDPGAAAGIAAAYLRRVPDAPARLGALRDRLAGLDHPGDARAWLAAARRDDFAAGEVLVLDGWVLARAEAELLALAAALG
jgi:hypothetical protein